MLKRAISPPPPPPKKKKKKNGENEFVHQGRIQDFHLGDAKDHVRPWTSPAQTPKSLTAGVQGPLKGPGSSQDFDAFLCYLILIFKAFSYKMG